MNKKLVAVFTAFILITIYLSGCGTSSKTAHKEAANSADAPSPAEEKTEPPSPTDEVAATPTPAGEITTVPAPVGDETDAGFSMTMLDVGEGLCLLFEADGKYMLYDGGGRETSSYVVSYLKKQGVKELELVIASHYDEDHIGGIIGAVSTTRIKAFLGPDYEATTSIYTSLVYALSNAGLENTHPSAGDEYAFGGARVKVISADAEAPAENDRSIAVIVSYGDIKILVTGDCESPSESAMISSGVLEPVDIYVPAHHGASSSSGKEFLAAVHPAYAFLSCSLGGENLHPARTVLNNLKECGTKLFRTDLQGEVTAYSDGKTLWFSEEDTSDWRNGSELTIQDDGAVSEPMDYVLNTNSKKFHYPDCDSVSDMSERNKKAVHMSREEIISMGYESCGRCHP